MRILFSTNYVPGFEIKSGRYGDHDVVVLPRSSDFGLRAFQRHWHYMREAWNLYRLAKEYDAIVLASTCMETFFLAAFFAATHCATPIICADFLIPRNSFALSLTAGALRRINHFVCIRSGDIRTLHRRFGIPPTRCSFAPFPCHPCASIMPTGDDGYLYSAGWAHRDWITLLRALEKTGTKAILSTGENLPPANSGQIQILRQRSPEEGRRLMANASLVVLPLADTELPTGPIVLLDAMAMGKAVIVTDVNGSRDYMKHGLTGWVVPPGDATAMASAISHLMNNSVLRRRLGSEARARALTRFTTEHFINAVIKNCVSK